MAKTKGSTDRRYAAPLYKALMAAGATLCPHCGDYMIHELPCDGRAAREERFARLRVVAWEDAEVRAEGDNALPEAA